MSISAHLLGRQFELYLPVRLSEQARRQATLRTGIAPNGYQTLFVDDLTKLPDDQRNRLLDLADKIEVYVGEEDSPSAPIVTSYSWLHRGHDGWQVWSDNGGGEPDSVDLKRLFVASPGRSRTLVEHLGEREGNEAVCALLDGEPLVKALTDEGELTVDVVLATYEAALALTDTLIAAAAAAPRPEVDNIWRTGIAWGKDVIVLAPREQLTPCGFVRASDPKVFEQALKLVRDMNELPIPQAEYFVTRACSFAASLQLQSGGAATDAEVLRQALHQAAEGARIGAADKKRQHQARDAYEHERDRWIDLDGSRRLRLARDRGYRHDGLYRDERLAAELPGFRASLGKRIQVKEIINPSEEALDLEQEVLDAAADLRPKVDVRLVFLKIELNTFEPEIEGEFVEISNYLGRFKAYRPVQPDDDPEQDATVCGDIGP